MAGNVTAPAPKSTSTEPLAADVRYAAFAAAGSSSSQRRCRTTPTANVSQLENELANAGTSGGTGKLPIHTKSGGTGYERATRTCASHPSWAW
ncbi:hypothetical protein [Dactylosporangium darangshiense]|uniref:hypothetical protein n=1 Tax=Dactylosporangium darangshiense TaxID=579108 RepID=UPI0031F0D921